MPAVVLPGGGARAAYQVGVLRAIGEIVGGDWSPFPVICGTSAGAINAAVLASHAHEYTEGVERLGHYWATMECERIYRTDAWTVLGSGLAWATSLASAGLLRGNPRALLDNTPLREFLRRELRLEGIDVAIREGALRGVSITASGYTRASAISFYQGADDIHPWRRGQPGRLDVPHLLASASLPLIFPAERIGHEYFGDGGMRMVAPLSPAVHLGADRILVIGNRDERPDPAPTAPAPYPSLGELGGYLLDTIFMDMLNADLARLERINRTLELIPPGRRKLTHLRPIRSMVIRPRRDLRELTREHVAEIPRSVRMLLRAMGGWGRDWRMASYLLFSAPYCQALLRMGHEDGLAAREKIREFLLAPA